MIVPNAAEPNTPREQWPGVTYPKHDGGEGYINPAMCYLTPGSVWDALEDAALTRCSLDVLERLHAVAERWAELWVPYLVGLMTASRTGWTNHVPAPPTRLESSEAVRKARKQDDGREDMSEAIAKLTKETLKGLR
jgi:hypothetical protein